MSTASESVRNVRRVQGAYGGALLLVLASVAWSMTATDGALGLLVAGALQAAALITVLLVSEARRRLVVAAVIASVTASLLAAGLNYADGPLAGVVAVLLWGLIVAAAIAAIVRYLKGSTDVDARVVLGLITVYLLIGLLFAYAFRAVDLFAGPFFAQGAHDQGAFVYFAYVTLATVGYGDLTPAAGLPRALAILVGMLGQLYLVTVVALAVGRLSGRAKRDG